jgi:hypothetical protein
MKSPLPSPLPMPSPALASIESPMQRPGKRNESYSIDVTDPDQFLDNRIDNDDEHRSDVKRT